MHLQQNIASAHELALEVDLRNGRPIRKVLDALPQSLVLEDVVRREGNVVHAEDLDHGVGEAASGLLGYAFHEDDHVGLLDQGPDAVFNPGPAAAQGSSKARV